TIAAGGSFDGGGATFDRGVSCTGQAEGGGGDAVFVIESGGSLSNVVIGPNQIEGVHCNGGCKLSNVEWTAVCEDAFTIKKQAAGETTTITGGSSKGATDKVFQFNGAGTLSISGFTADGFGSFVRNCGNCKESAERHVIIDGVTASNGRTLCGINTNASHILILCIFGDTCKVTNTKLSSVTNVCMKYTGVSSGSEPKEIGAGADGTSCIYGSDVTGGA
ncbi:pectate lyase, partial [Cadophora sp. MPI-SDFR-AT-0126]